MKDHGQEVQTEKPDQLGDPLLWILRSRLEDLRFLIFQIQLSLLLLQLSAEVRMAINQTAHHLPKVQTQSNFNLHQR